MIENNSLCRPETFKPNKNYSETINPVHQHTDDKWYFCDETWGTCYGPYDNEEIANEKLNEYCISMLGPAK